MKRLTTYLNEKLIVNKHYKQHIYSPKSWKELRQIVEKRFDELGPGTEQEPIDFNDIDVSNIDSFRNKDAEYGIFNETKFEYIDISKWDVSKVESMYSLFGNCEKLISVGDLSNWDVSSVKDIRFMFVYCRKLTSIGNISNWDVSNIEKMNGMFYACSNLKSVGDLSKWNISTVCNNEYMFKYSGITNKPDWYKE